MLFARFYDLYFRKSIYPPDHTQINFWPHCIIPGARAWFSICLSLMATFNSCRRNYECQSPWVSGKTYLDSVFWLKVLLHCHVYGNHTFNVYLINNAMPPKILYNKLSWIWVEMWNSRKFSDVKISQYAFFFCMHTYRSYDNNFVCIIMPFIHVVMEEYIS